MQAKQITATSWILTSNLTSKKVGLVLQKSEGFKLVSEPALTFNSLEDIAKHFGEKLKNIKAEETDIEPINEINGWPIKHSIAYNIESDNDTNLHCYTIKPESKMIYVAGYFGLKFKHGYVGSFCPKISSLFNNDYIGPFKDKFEMQFQMLKINRENNQNG